MADVQNPFRHRPPAPAAYLRFVTDSKVFVQSKGVAWEIEYDEAGDPRVGTEWDLRKLTDSHARNSSSLGSFAVNVVARNAARAAGWAEASLPTGPVLETEVQSFIKALAVRECRDGGDPKTTADLARLIKALFSTACKAPWEFGSADLERFIALDVFGQRGEKHIRSFARVVNEHLLSSSCPLIAPDFRADNWKGLHASLQERGREDRLPERQSLYELARIVFQAVPQTHNDRIRFHATRIVILTGLRLMEVLMLPADCLRWEDHVDCVSGVPAGDVGGVSRTLRLRYFGEKREETAPDLLVEDEQWVPNRFQDAVAMAVTEMQVATAGLRSVLTAQHQRGVFPDGGDTRTFKTTAGHKLTTADLLFLQSGAGQRDVPLIVPDDHVVTTLSPNGMYLALGLHKPRSSSSFFVRYGDPANEWMSVKPHSLRHLMNTELFRLGVSDTVITQQFGRTTIAQSYEYDHRSLAEKLEFVRIPSTAIDVIKPGSSQELIAKMVVGGMVPSSHIAQSFKAIQVASGDAAAFRYLAASSDGFHVTPYGFCVNSFSMNPCSRHLKCFDNCKHFVASGLREHTITLQSLRDQLTVMRASAASKPAKTVGRSNQIAHADALLAGVEAALRAEPSTPVFGGGIDHSRPREDVLS